MKTESEAWAHTGQQQYLGPRCWLFCSGVGSSLWGVGMCGAAVKLESGAWVNADRPWSWGLECRTRWSYRGSVVKCAQVWKVLAALTPGHHHSSFFPTCAAVMAMDYPVGKQPESSVVQAAGAHAYQHYGVLLCGSCSCGACSCGEGCWGLQGHRMLGSWGPPWSLFCGSHPFSLFPVVLRHLP